MRAMARIIYLIVGILCTAVGAAHFHQLPTAQAQDTLAASYFEDIEFVKQNTLATLLFVPFGSNPDFTKHNLSDDSVLKICGGTQGDCQNVGVNFGTVFVGGKYEKAQEFGMKWTLEIADGGKPQDVIKGITEKGIENVIVRFGIAGNSIGFTENPESVISFLNQVGNSVGGKEFYAIAGPNEPDIETWVAPECGAAPGTPTEESEAFYSCVGPKLASFMNAVCDAKKTGRIPSNVKLLTPAFNMTSYTFDGIVSSMQVAGARFSDNCFEAVAGNLYPAGKSMQQYWEDQNIDRFGKPIIITETAPLDGNRGNQNAQKLGYNTSNFPPYNADDSQFYIHPIVGLSPDADVSTIRQDLAMQGYEAYCASRQYRINPSYNTEELIDKFLQLNPSGTQLLVTSNASQDLTNDFTPIYRDVRGNSWLTNSIEEYWGFTDTVHSDFSTTEINSAPINSLLNEVQRCTQSIKTLAAQESMCGKLEDPSTCALLDREIRSTTFTVESLLGAVKQFTGESNTDAIAASAEQHCEDLFSQVRTEQQLGRETGAAPGPNQTLKEALLVTPLQIERSYRLAFLVAAIRQRRDEYDRSFNFFSPKRRAAVPPHEVLVTAFKIPDIATNKGTVVGENSIANSGKGSGHTGWNDPALLTRNVLLPEKTIESLEEAALQRRQETYNRAEQARLQTADSTIYCLAVGDAPGGIGSSDACHNELGKAVVDIVNAQEGLNCAGFSDKTEPVTDILDPAHLNANPTPVFNEDYGLNLLANLFFGPGMHADITHLPSGQPETATTEFESLFRIERQAWGGDRDSDSTVDFYLVYPVGYDLATIEDAISGAFFTSSQISLLQDDPLMRDGFAMSATRSFSASTQSRSFVDTTEVCGEDEFGRPYYCQKSFSVSVGSESYEDIRLLGGRLGYWMRNIQRNLHTLMGEPQKYFSACRTTEEFLLGYCGKQSPITQVRPATVAGNYCGSRKVDGVLRNDSSMLEVVHAGSKQPADPKLVLNNSASSEFRIAVSSRFVDGATLIMTNTISHQNPGLNSAGRCGGSYGGATNPDTNPTLLEIWRLPLEYRDQIGQYSTWLQHGYILRPKLEAGAFTSVTVDVQVQPGIYGVRVQGSACHMGVLEFVNGATEFFVFDNTEGVPERTNFCGKLTINSMMSGGGYGDPEKDFQRYAGACDLVPERVREAVEAGMETEAAYAEYLYAVEQWNNACGGGSGSKESNFWDDFVNSVRNGTMTVERRLEGLEKYREIFGRDFVASFPGGGYMCQTIFPNTLQELDDCSSISNGDVQPPSNIGEIPFFQIEWYDVYQDTRTLNPRPGPMTNFTLPQDEAFRNEVLTEIEKASALHGCDPLLMLAVFHSETRISNPTTENGATAVGIGQFTRDAWRTWWNGRPGVCHQPSTYEPRTPRPSLADRTNLPLAIDASCRHFLWTDAQSHPENREQFIINFALQHTSQYYANGNPLGQIWNVHTPQADYVWRLWKKLREVTGSQPQPMPAGYPPDSC